MRGAQHGQSSKLEHQSERGSTPGSGDHGCGRGASPRGTRWRVEMVGRSGHNVAVTPYEPWLPWPPRTYDRWPLVVQLSARVSVEWFEYCFPIHWPSPGRFEVSGIGTIAVARVVPVSGEDPFIAVSMYARWRPPHPSVGDSQYIHAEASAHRIISDLSAFTSHRKGSTHRILAAGDLNMGFVGRFESEGRSLSVLTRMNALGLEYLGPVTSSGESAHAANRRPGASRSDDADGPCFRVARVSRQPAGAGDERSR